jgi:hypothetical protein
MYIKRNWGIVHHSVAALTFALALAGTNIAGATGVSFLAGAMPVDAWHSGQALTSGVVYEQGSDVRYSANPRQPLFSSCSVDGCALAASVSEQTNSQARTSVSALVPSMQWRSSSFSVAGSRVWSKLIVFTSTSINVRLPIN